MALDGVSFDVERGSITGLIGPNGAGKATVLNVVTRLYTPDEGELELEGSSLLHTPAQCGGLRASSVGTGSARAVETWMRTTTS